MRVGFIGLGNMGIGMAENLLKAGNDVTVYNRTSSKSKALVKQGAHYAPIAVAVITLTGHLGGILSGVEAPTG